MIRQDLDLVFDRLNVLLRIQPIIKYHSPKAAKKLLSGFLVICYRYDLSLAYAIFTMRHFWHSGYVDVNGSIFSFISENDVP